MIKFVRWVLLLCCMGLMWLEAHAGESDGGGGA